MSYFLLISLCELLRKIGAYPVKWVCYPAGVGAGITLRRSVDMAAMKPRTGDGPLEVSAEGRGIVMRIPTEGGGRLVIELTPDEAAELAGALGAAI